MDFNTHNARPWGYRAALATGLLVFWGLFGFFWQVSRSRTTGHFFYPLDDTYITMAIARNLADNGTWGPVAHEFSSCASSPFWVLALASVYRLFGPNEWAPLLLSLASGTALVVVVCHVLRGLDVKPVATLAILLAAILLDAPGSGRHHGIGTPVASRADAGFCVRGGGVAGIPRSAAGDGQDLGRLDDPGSADDPRSLRGGLRDRRRRGPVALPSPYAPGDGPTGPWRAAARRSGDDLPVERLVLLSFFPGPQGHQSGRLVHG